MPRPCTTPGCTRPAESRDLCRPHHRRWLRHQQQQEASEVPEPPEAAITRTLYRLPPGHPARPGLLALLHEQDATPGP